MFFLKPTIIRCPWLLRGSVKRLKKDQKILYLSFDDGPTPIITEKVLDILNKYEAKASFFCLGKNAEKHPEIMKLIKKFGHTIGNHGYSHQNAFKVSGKKWINDIFKPSPVSESKYFRPPYGNLLPWEYTKIKNKYQLVLWDVMTYDFREGFASEKVINIAKNKIRNGSIIVFHDSIKAEKNMLPTLEFTLEYFSKKNYRFENL
ncbi:polysaccharide deacetylase family protein [Bacteroidales bacterium OttesenSCG-928-I21]|nr:polysaccharide deacetylase family protein [Bacteroidales bacterium OttesenSCG-928-I21]